MGHLWGSPKESFVELRDVRRRDQNSTPQLDFCLGSRLMNYLQGLTEGREENWRGVQGAGHGVGGGTVLRAEFL